LSPYRGHIPHVCTERLDDVRLDTAMSNSFGFGGTDASPVFRAP